MASRIFVTDLDLNGNKLKSVATPTLATDGATKGYVDGAIVPRPKFSGDVGDGTALTFNVDHNLNTLDVIVQVYRKSDGVTVETGVTRSTVNRVVVDFAGTAPTAAQYRVVVLG